MEYERFVLMLLHAFLSGLGIALSYTLISILIVKSHLEYLPFLYLLTGVLLLTKGYFYAHFEHNNQPRKVFSWVLAGIFFWALLMFVNLSIWESFIVVALAYCSYYVTYYLSNLEYWGAASLLFNVRQGKRLFGLLSSGESVAMILGYAVTPLIITRFSTSAVYLVVAMSFGGAFLIFRRLSKNYKNTLSVSHQHASVHSLKPEDTHGKVMTILSIRDIFKMDSFRRFISIFAFVSTVTYFLLNYAFLVRVKENFYDTESIAVFFASIFTIAKFLNLIIKVFFAGRVCQYLGLKAALLILPILLLVTNLVGITGVMTGQIEETFLMWIFAIIIVIDEIFRSSLYTPSYLALFQPLTKVERLEGHTLTKAIMEPLGLVGCGVLIVLMTEIDAFHLHTVAPVILILLLLWIFLGFKVFGGYMAVLKGSLQSRILAQGVIQFSKNEFDILKNEKLNSDDPVEKLYALTMLKDQLSDDDKRRHLIQLLQSENSYILSESIAYLQDSNITDINYTLLNLVDHPDRHIVKMAYMEYARLNQMVCVEYFKGIYDGLDDTRKGFVTVAAIKYGGLYGAIDFGPNLIQLVESKDKNKRVFAAELIGELDNYDYYHPLAELLEDQETDVLSAAIKSAGKVTNPALLHQLISLKENKLLRPMLSETLGAFEDELYQRASEMLEEASVHEKIDLLRLFRNNVSESITTLYFEFCKDANFDVRKEAYGIIYNNALLNNVDGHRGSKAQIDGLISHINRIISVIPSVENGAFRRLLINELYNVQLKVLIQIVFLSYSRKLFNNLMDSCYSTDIKDRVLALEMLDNSLTARDKFLLVPVVEKVFDITEHSQVAEQTDMEVLNAFVKEVISDGNQNYSSWLLANCLRHASNNEGFSDQQSDLSKNDLLVIKQEYKRFSKTA